MRRGPRATPSVHLRQTRVARGGLGLDGRCAQLQDDQAVFFSVSVLRVLATGITRHQHQSASFLHLKLRVVHQTPLRHFDAWLLDDIDQMFTVAGIDDGFVAWLQCRHPSEDCIITRIRRTVSPNAIGVLGLGREDTPYSLVTSIPIDLRRFTGHNRRVGLEVPILIQTRIHLVLAVTLAHRCDWMVNDPNRRDR